MKLVKPLFLFVVASMLFLSGCVGNDTSFGFDPILGWINRTGYERVEYIIDRQAVVTNSTGEVTDHTTIATGTLVMELFDDTPDQFNVTIKTSFSLTYNEYAPDDLIGTSDTMTSEVIANYDFVPKSSTRTQTFGGQTQTLTADYMSLKATKTTDTQTKTLKLGGGIYVDNESVLYAVRAHSYAPGKTAYFQLANLSDIFENGSFFTHTMALSTHNDTTNINLPIPLSGWGLEDPSSLPCHRVTMFINDPNSGTALDMYYASVPLTDGTNTQKKVLAQLITTEFDVSTVRQSHRMVYTLKSLTV